jgi:hypothetical protein
MRFARARLISAMRSARKWSGKLSTYISPQNISFDSFVPGR